ncbi:selenocysteine-specific translation elongation factor [candidate division KSB1 bacterium]|nr:selenocysteine-specific translation elongation factor [candidate division KSB1 bacterium]
MQRHVVIGTAGHIDHGKTSLVKALTGMDPDRLDEEKARGMTIDLGFAFLGDQITIIDVPGHEKFIRNMVAGVSTIDLVLFVIAADDGIMPQSREHLEILNLLQIQQGIIVLTKIDIVDPEWLALVTSEVHDFVQGTFLAQAPILHVSNTTGAGIPELHQAIQQLVKNLPPRPDRGIFRLPIDRVFTLKGFGTVVTGTVLSGQLHVEDPIELLPQQRRLRVRGLQIHGQQVGQVAVGDRAAINLAGIEKDEIGRGNVLAAPGIYQPTIYYDSKIYLLKTASQSLTHNSRVRLHLGTNELVARIRLLDVEEIKPGMTAVVQWRGETPIVAEIRDRFVIRNYSPLVTLGGGLILQINPPRHKRFDPTTINRLKQLEHGDLQDVVEQALLKGKITPRTLDELSKIINLPTTDLQQNLQQLTQQKRVVTITGKSKAIYLHISHFQRLKNEILGTLKKYHQENPWRLGISNSELSSSLNLRGEIQLMQFLVHELEAENLVRLISDKVQLTEHKIVMTPAVEVFKKRLEQFFFEQKFAPPHTSAIITQFKAEFPGVAGMIDYLLEQQLLVYIEDGMLMHQHWVQNARETIIVHFQNNSELTMGAFRDKIEASRKYALPLLNYFDQQGLTIRQGDIRIFGEITPR